MSRARLNYIKEMLIDNLSSNPVYKTENIQNFLEKYLKLKYKKENKDEFHNTVDKMIQEKLKFIQEKKQKFRLSPPQNVENLNTELKQLKKNISDLKNDQTLTKENKKKKDELNAEISEIEIKKQNLEDEHVRVDINEINNLEKEKVDFELTTFEELELLKFENFFEDILDFKTDEECNTGLYSCFEKQLVRAKTFIEKEARKYDIVISEYMKLLDKSPYNTNDPKYLQYMKYIKKKLLLAKSKSGSMMLDENQVNTQTNKGKNKKETKKHDDDNENQGNDVVIDNGNDDNENQGNDVVIDNGNDDNEGQGNNVVNDDNENQGNDGVNDDKEGQGNNVVNDDNENQGNDGVNDDNEGQGNDVVNDDNENQGNDVVNDDNEDQGNDGVNDDNEDQGNDVVNDDNEGQGNDVVNDENENQGNDVVIDNGNDDNGNVVVNDDDDDDDDNNDLNTSNQISSNFTNLYSATSNASSNFVDFNTSNQISSNFTDLYSVTSNLSSNFVDLNTSNLSSNFVDLNTSNVSSNFMDYNNDIIFSNQEDDSGSTNIDETTNNLYDKEQQIFNQLEDVIKMTQDTEELTEKVPGLKHERKGEEILDENKIENQSGPFIDTENNTLDQLEDVIKMTQDTEELRENIMNLEQQSENTEVTRISQENQKLLDEKLQEENRKANEQVTNIVNNTNAILDKTKQNDNIYGEKNTLDTLEDVIRMAQDTEELMQRLPKNNQSGGKKNLQETGSESDFNIILMDLNAKIEHETKMISTLTKSLSNEIPEYTPILDNFMQNSPEEYEHQNRDFRRKYEEMSDLVEKTYNDIEKFTKNVNQFFRYGISDKFNKIKNVYKNLFKHIDQLLGIFKENSYILKYTSEKSRIDTIKDITLFEMFLQSEYENLAEKEKNILKEGNDFLQGLEDLKSNIKYIRRKFKERDNRALQKLYTYNEEEFPKKEDNLKRNNTKMKDILTLNDFSQNKQLTKIQKSLKTILDRLTPKSKSTLSKVVSGSNGDETMYSQIWNQYMTDVKDENKLFEDTRDKLYKSYKSNNLDPSDVLSPTLDDKIIFVVITFIIRQVVLTFVEMMIDNGMITNLYMSLIYYIVFYVAILLFIIILVNLDDYKFRILLNYFNLHGNLYGIFGHIAVFISIFLVLYVLIYNMNPSIHGTKPSLTEVEKINLSYKLELITIAVFATVASMELIILL
jgi:hypothetical protein